QGRPRTALQPLTQGGHMKRAAMLALTMTTASMLVLGASVRADDMKAGAMMEMPKPGPEAMALGKFFGKSWSWTGTTMAGAMGPESKAMKTHGWAKCHPTPGGFGYACDVEDVCGMGKSAMTYHGMMTVGYDMGEQKYKAFCADNMGGMM